MTIDRWACVCFADPPPCDQALKLLQRFSPEVESSQKEAQVFWLNASGLSAIYASLRDWGMQLSTTLDKSRIAIGFSRFGSYAAAKHTKHPLVCFESTAEETNYIERVPLRCLKLDDKDIQLLDALGIYTVGAFARLPAATLRQRFGDDGVRLHQQACSVFFPAIQSAMHTHDPLCAAAILEPLYQHIELLEPDNNLDRLLFSIKRVLHALIAKVALKQAAIIQLELFLHCESRFSTSVHIKPAEATLDAAQLLQLLQLKLLSTALPERVVSLDLHAQTIPATRDQLLLFAKKPRRPLADANRALARIRAEYGEHTVLSVVLCEAHLPEAQFQWQPLSRLHEAQPGSLSLQCLVRRFYVTPVSIPTPPPPRLEFGPYVLQGGWWNASIRRDYYFARDATGSWSWIFFDHKRHSWFVQGKVS